ncbi:MAG: putative lipid II flippase FtsW [Pseudomonadota bacterium]
MGEGARTDIMNPTISLRRGLGPDFVILGVTALILTIGIVMVTSSGFIIASGKFGDGFYYTKKQVLAIVIGLGFMYLFSIINPAFWKRIAAHLMIIALISLGLVFVPALGVEMGGSHRWLKLPLGFFFQPSEFAKFALVIFMAASISKKAESIKDFATGFLPHVLVMGVVVGLILLQPDFGNAVIITLVSFLMLFVAGVRVQHLLGSLVLCLPILFHLALSAPYRLARLKTFIDPLSDPLKAGWQVFQSLTAFGCGGVWGAGIGKGLQKLFYLPQPHTDFIFAVVGEETGLVGVVVLILLFYVLICRGLVASIRAKDPFSRYVAFGITTLIGLQAIVNMAVAMGILPTKGLPLPLVSVGGTSVIMNLAGIGILMAASKSSEKEPREARS